jgi:copper(I)-binding protein
MVIHNMGSGADRLVKVETDAAVLVDLREPASQESLEQMAKSIEVLEIPVGGQVEFLPGMYQMALLGLKGDLVEGEKIKLKLVFEQSGVIDVEAVIAPREE